MGRKIILILILMIITACARQDGVPRRADRAKVLEIADCTETVADAWNGATPGKCRVILDNGARLTVERPVGIGDTVEYMASGWPRPRVVNEY